MERSLVGLAFLVLSFAPFDKLRVLRRAGRRLWQALLDPGTLQTWVVGSNALTDKFSFDKSET